MDLARVDVTSSITLAHDRYLPVDEAFAALLPDPGLVRGRIVACTGAAATSLALALASRATTTGSWLAVVGMAPIGIEAARELGVAIDRLVSIDADACRPDEWADRVATAADGFELVLTVPPTGPPTGPPTRAERVFRKVRQRVQARGVVLLIVDSGASHSGAGADMVLEVTAGEWEGLGRGHGHLFRRRVVVRAGGRRVPRPVERELWLPGIAGRPELIEPATTVATATAGNIELERAG
ncbi:MAG TPA: hypothetical protein VFV63_08090 [Ilumatobacteraceae bacterium]|nr:hypothetical protein [Ilumatobacteraceae bacterium]